MEALSPSIVLAAYAEPLLDGRRVVLFGDATSDVADELIERGARSVHVYDPEPPRAAMAAGQNRSKQISVSPIDDADLAVRDGAFDVALVEDLSTFANPATLLKLVRRALASRGAAIVASPNAESKVSLLPRASAARSSSPLGYYELYDAVSAEFPEVRMLGQTPFVGYAVVDFAPEGDADVSIDSGLVPGGAEEPEWFVALASRDRLDCDPVGIVQLPARRIAGGGVSGTLSDELRAARTAEAKLLERVAALEVEATGLRAQSKQGGAESVERADRFARELSQKAANITALEAEVASAAAREEKTRAEVATLRRSAEGGNAARAELANLLPERNRLLAELETRKSENAELAKRNKEFSSQKSDGAERSARFEAEQSRLTEAVERQRTEFSALQQKLVHKDAQIQELQAALAAVPPPPPPPPPPALEDAPNDLGQLEAALKERGEHVRKLSGELREAERVGRELLRELGHAKGAASGAEPILAENARLQANLEALAWTVEELEGRLTASPAPPR